MWSVSLEGESRSSPFHASSSSSFALPSRPVCEGRFQHAGLEGRAYCGVSKSDGRPRKTSEIENRDGVSQGHCFAAPAEQSRGVPDANLGESREAVYVVAGTAPHRLSTNHQRPSLLLPLTHSLHSRSVSTLRPAREKKERRAPHCNTAPASVQAQVQVQCNKQADARPPGRNQKRRSAPERVA